MPIKTGEAVKIRRFTDRGALRAAVAVTAAAGALYLASERFLPRGVSVAAVIALYAAAALVVWWLGRTVAAAVLAARPAAETPAADDLPAAFARIYRDRESLKAQIEELATARELALAVLSNLEPARMYASALEAAASVVGSRSVALHLLQGDPPALLPVASGDGTSPEPGRAARLAARECRAVSFAEEAPGEGTRIAVPLVARGECLGVVEARGVDSDALPALKNLAAPIAVAAANARLYEMAVADGLTGLFVSRHFRSRMREEIHRALRYRRPLSLVMIDVDHFKNVNDTYGHLVGDRVLKGVAKSILQHARSADLPARYGGEEMAILLPETDIEGAVRLAERIRQAIEETVFEGEAGETFHVTVSAGIAVAPPARTGEALVSAADACLYRAKHAGRNRVVAEEPPAAAAAS